MHTVLADRKGHGTERTDRSDLHDHVDDLEKDVRTLFDDVEDKGAATAEFMQGNPEKYGEEENLQDVAFCKSAHHRVGDDVHQELGRRFHLVA